MCKSPDMNTEAVKVSTNSKELLCKYVSREEMFVQPQGYAEG